MLQRIRRLIELYPVSATKTTAFRERHDTKFQVNTLYRKHPRLKEKVYLPCTSFVRELDGGAISL